jgi:hypothetical protein
LWEVYNHNQKCPEDQDINELAAFLNTGAKASQVINYTVPGDFAYGLPLIINPYKKFNHEQREKERSYQNAAFPK